jgi:MoxR-like ATPase
MRPTQVAEAIRVAMHTNRAAFIWGPPGAGKSSIVNQVAEEDNRRVVDVRLSQLESVDLRGIPQVDKETNRVHWAIPEFLPREEDGPTLLFLDEMNAGLPSTQAAAYQLVLDRRLGSYKVPDNCAIIAAGNRDGDRGVTYTMPAPLANRFIHLEYEVNFDDWRKWALGAGIRTEVLSYLAFRPGSLMDFDPNKKAFPTPRSWEFVSDTLTIDGSVSPEVERALIAGSVGDGVAAEFAGFLKIHRNLPNPDYVLLNPDKAEVPKDPATLYALVGALSERVNDSNFDRFVKYIERVKPEFQVLAIRDAMIRQPVLINTPTFSAWAGKNASFVL